MTIRAFVIGVLLAMVVCVFGYYLQWVVKLPSLINGGMPLLAFGTLVLLVLVGNPLIGLVKKEWMFSPGELAVVMALGICACSYTGASFFRYYGGMMAGPPHFLKNKNAWQSSGVMSYVPDGTGEIATGFVTDFSTLALRIVEEQDQDTLAGGIWDRSSGSEQDAWVEASTTRGPISSALQTRMVRSINTALADPAWGGLDRDLAEHEVVKANRALLVEAMPDLVLPSPKGKGALIYGGRGVEAVTQPVIFGHQSGDPSKWLGQVPWDAWWPVIWRWGGLMIGFVVVVGCLAVIVRPQWAEHERLAFPIARFAELLVDREEGKALPKVVSSKLFWGGFIALMVLHLFNGIHTWQANLPDWTRGIPLLHFPQRLDFWPLARLFPNASRVGQSWGAFNPLINFTVIAFAFFLPRPVSLTFGISTYVMMFIGGLLLANEVDLNGGQEGAPLQHLVAFGAMLGMVGVMAYTGRRYYGNVLWSAFGGTRSRETPASAPRAARVVLILVPASMWWLAQAGVSPMFAVMSVLVVLMLWLVTARIVCETGLYRFGDTITPIGLLIPLFGFDGIGPTQVILVTMVAILFATDLWETPMAFMLTGFQTAKRTGTSTGQLMPAVLAVAVLGFGAAMVGTLVTQYEFGTTKAMEDWASRERPQLGLNNAQLQIDKLASEGALSDTVQLNDAGRLASLSLSGWTVGWLAFGLLGFVGFSAARFRLPWWPIHPILFVVLGNWGMTTYGFSFLIGWFIKTAVVSVGGAKAYQQMLPMMVGVIAAGLVSGLGWLVVGLVYTMVTGAAPVSYEAY